MNKQEIGALMALAVANYPTMQSKDMRPTLFLWEKLLADLTYTEAEEALVRVLLLKKDFFPTVGDIRDGVKELRRARGDGPPDPDQAWLEVLGAFRESWKEGFSWSHPAVGLAVKTLGGLRTIGDSTNIEATRAQFRMVYEAELGRRENSEVEAVIGRLRELNGGSLSLIGGPTTKRLTEKEIDDKRARDIEEAERRFKG